MSNCTAKIDNVDVIVAGSGMAGLIAALSAQEAGASVVVLEKAPEIGGSAVASGGTVWTASDLKTWLRITQSSDTALGQAMLDSFDTGIPWLRSQGIVLKELPPDRMFRFDHRAYKLMPDTRSTIEHLAHHLSTNGGTILTGTGLHAIHLNEQGSIDGVLAQGPDGNMQFSAHSVVLATGGFQANPKLCAQYFGRWSDSIVLRSNPHSSGDGLVAATKIGADTVGPFDRCYGHLVPAPPAQVGLHNFLDIKPAFCHFAIFVNLNGERFDDEFLGDEVTVQATIQQPEGIACLIFDEAMRRNRSGNSPAPGMNMPYADAIENIRQIGGEILQKSTLEALVDEMSSRWKVDGKRLNETLVVYNSACIQADASILPVAKTGGLDPLTTPPFYAIRMLPGVTFTYGGIRINPQAQVLDKNRAPIPGLYAAGADAGGIYTRGYTGGLALGLAFGRIAGKVAARHSMKKSLADS